MAFQRVNAIRPRKVVEQVLYIRDENLYREVMIFFVVVIKCYFFNMPLNTVMLGPLDIFFITKETMS